jgi:thioredoxin 1
MKKILYYTSGWCQPCQTLGPIMDEISKDIYVEKVNIDYEIDRARAVNVSSIPTVILVENEQEVRRFVGVRSYEQIKQFIQ